MENYLKPVIKEIWKQRRLVSIKDIKLHDDNARAHIYSDVINYLTEEDMKIMAYPPHSPDLALCVYWLNDYMKRNLMDHANEK